MRRRWLLFLAVFAALPACSKVGAPPPAVYPVRGKVVQASGEPLYAGRVVFHPVQLHRGLEVTVEVEKDGTFKIADNAE